MLGLSARGEMRVFCFFVVLGLSGEGFVKQRYLHKSAALCG